MLLQKAGIKKSRSHNFIGYAFNLIMFLSAFAASSLIINYVNPDLEIPLISSKLKSFAQNKDEYNTIFVGSSRIYRHISIMKKY